MEDLRPLSDWLPITRKEVESRGWEQLDVVIVSGDAYVDHPSFGAAVIGRVLEHEGFRVGLIPQPNWRDDGRDFRKMGAPRLFFGVSAGSMDSMVNHYTARRRRRSDDAYTPGGVAGFRPDYPTLVYTRLLKQFFPDVPVVAGGIEASLRRVTHYDYWQDKLLPSFAAESGADLLVYGMGEKPVAEIARRLDRAEKAGLEPAQAIAACRDIPQVCFVADEPVEAVHRRCPEALVLASHEACLQSKKQQARNFALVETASNRMDCEVILQGVGHRTVVINPPYPIYDFNVSGNVAANATETFDSQQYSASKTKTKNVSETAKTDAQAVHPIDYAFDLPYTRLPHPKYKSRGDIPAYTMIRHSVNIHRGCFGGCAFCTISAHQGKQVQSRSEASILKEVEQVVNMPDFKGYLSDLGGPSANMYDMRGRDLTLCRRCSRPSCIVPSVCKNLRHDLKPLTALFEKVSGHPKIKKCFIGSGIRYDLIVPFLDTNVCGARDYAETIIRKGVSGRLKVAPEHTEENVLRTMRKMPFEQFIRFKRFFDEVCRREGLRQQLIPYFISAHPNCRLQDMQALSEKTHAMGYHLEQVQLFTPTPMTLATEMFYTGLDPHTLQPVFVERDDRRRDEQNRCFFEESRRPAGDHGPRGNNYRPERDGQNRRDDRLQNRKEPNRPPQDRRTGRRH